MVEFIPQSKGRGGGGKPGKKGDIGLQGIPGPKGDNGSSFSNPPSGKCKVTNIYYDFVTEKLIVEYESIPV